MHSKIKKGETQWLYALYGLLEKLKRNRENKKF